MLAIEVVRNYLSRCPGAGNCHDAVPCNARAAAETRICCACCRHVAKQLRLCYTLISQPKHALALNVVCPAMQLASEAVRRCQSSII